MNELDILLDLDPWEVLYAVMGLGLSGQEVASKAWWLAAVSRGDVRDLMALSKIWMTHEVWRVYGEWARGAGWDPVLDLDPGYPAGMRVIGWERVRQG